MEHLLRCLVQGTAAVQISDSIVGFSPSPLNQEPACWTKTSVVQPLQVVLASTCMQSLCAHLVGSVSVSELGLGYAGAVVTFLVVATDTIME